MRDLSGRLCLSCASRESVRIWVHRFSYLFRPFRRVRRLVAVDETVLKVKGQICNLWAAVDVDANEILAVYVSRGRGIPSAIKFLRKVLDSCVGKPFIVVDRGPWYRWALDRLGITYFHETFGKRNRIERWFRGMKERTKRFYNNINTKKSKSIEELVTAIAMMHNIIRAGGEEVIPTDSTPPENVMFISCKSSLIAINMNRDEIDEKITVNKTDRLLKRRVSELYDRKLAYPNNLTFDLFDPKLLPPNFSDAGAGTLKLIEGKMGDFGSFTVELSKRRVSMPFWHRNWDNDELILCIDGEAVWETEAGTIKLNPGKMIVIPRGIAHRVVIENNATNYVAVEIKSPSLKIIYNP